MSLTSTERTGIVSLSVAMFNAAPGATYLGELTNLFEANGRSLAELGKLLSATPVYQAISPTYQTAEEFAAQFLGPLNLSANAEAIAYVTSRINAGQSKGEVAAEAAAALAGYTGTDAQLLAAKATLANKTTVAENYSVVLGAGGVNLADLQASIASVTSDAASVAAAIAANKTGGTNPGQLFNLAVNGGAVNGVQTFDSLAGTSGNDLFLARIYNNANSLQSGDKLSGGAGNDRLEADVGTSQAFAITAETSSVEEVSIRAQANAVDNGANNVAGIVQIDAQRMVGVNQWESSNSRADVVIEDVRILPSQITKDITIAMIETDPGQVDFGVYFDQYSLRNQTSSTSQLNLKIMDTVAAANAATAATPLLNSNYGSFTFSTTIAGTTSVVTLASQAIQDAQTYTQLRDAFQAALDANFGVGQATASLGADFTVTDPVSNKAVTGQTIVLKANVAIAFTTPAGSGWAADGVSPPTSNLYTDFNTDATTTSSLVTSKIILDDVGRGSTGGDLVVGGLSVGTTSSSLGVQRFEIEVRDNSKLQVIQSTNNTLREVTVVNGVTTSSSFAYVNTAANMGDLSVLGNDGSIGAVAPVFGADAGLPGTGATNNAFGFTDVRLIDASAMTGKMAFDAQITSASIAKYMNLKDVQALPAGDNIAFVYTGGANNDTMFTTLDSAIVSSRSTIVSGREDMTFTANGGAGNDAITVNVAGPNGGLNGGAQAWYTNQKLNANIFVNGGDGNDVIRTPGAGDVKIDGGAGNDTIYTDNTGALAAIAQATGSASAAAIAYTNAAAAELAAGLAARVASNNTGFLHTDGVAIGVSITPAAQVAALATLDQITPTNPPALPVITHAALAAGTAAAAAAGAITLAQKVALDAAYNSATGGVVTPGALGAAATLVGHAAVAGNVTAAELAAGDAALATIVAAAKAAAATATVNDANVAVQNGLLNATQLAVIANNLLVNGVDDSFTGANEAGTATIVAGLATLKSALTVGASQLAVNAALDAATLNGSITAVVAGNIAGALGAFPVAAPGLAAATAILSPLQNTAALNNTAAQALLTAAIAADVAAVNTAAAFAAGDPVLAGAEAVVADSVGSAETTAAATAAATASTQAAADLAASQAINAALTGLKAAVNVGSLDADVTNAIANANAAIVAAIASSAANGTGAVIANPLTAPVQAALLVLAGVPSAAVDAAEELAFDTGALGVFDANAVDSLVIANTVQTDALTITAANAAATATATATANTIAIAAANSGANALSIASPKAVYVFNTADQTAAYNRLTQDERNLADLKSGANDSYNFFNTTVKVTFKGLDASVILPGTGYKTTNLEINQAIKQAINNDAVLSKLLLATDGPANSLVVTSLIDGQQALTNLAVTVTLPTTVTAGDLAGAITAHGLAAGTTEAGLLTAMAAVKTTFDTGATGGDYVTQWAESGAAGGNTNLVGANSLSSSDNTVTPGSGDDVIVLGTTVGTDLLTSSNEKVVYAADFGKDTIVYFAASGLGIDTLDLTALKGSGAVAFGSLTLDKSIVVAADTPVPQTTAQIAALFTDSATAINHVYIAYNTANVGSVYQVVDGAGVAAGNVTATLMGTIDLADTAWSSLTAANFA